VHCSRNMLYSGVESENGETGSSETLIHICQARRRHIPHDSTAVETWVNWDLKTRGFFISASSVKFYASAALPSRGRVPAMLVTSTVCRRTLLQSSIASRFAATMSSALRRTVGRLKILSVELWPIIIIQYSPGPSAEVSCGPHCARSLELTIPLKHKIWTKVMKILNIRSRIDFCALKLALVVIVANVISFYSYYNQQVQNEYHNSIYHKSVSLCNLYSYMFRHFHVIIREFHICALLSYINP